MIVFSGLDGAGKSTQIELLKFYFKNSEYQLYHFGVEVDILQVWNL